MSTTEEPVQFMEQLVSLDYKLVAAPVYRTFSQKMKDRSITGHKCPSCGKVYVPPKGFCPLCTVITTDKDEVAVADTGTVASFTVLTPIQYRGQQEREPYALASILLDGADSTVGQQRVTGLPLDDIRMGLRVKAVWASAEERGGDDDAGGWRGLGNFIKEWVPTGEPDAPADAYREHVL